MTKTSEMAPMAPRWDMLLLPSWSVGWAGVEEGSRRRERMLAATSNRENSVMARRARKKRG